MCVIFNYLNMGFVLFICCLKNLTQNCYHLAKYFLQRLDKLQTSYKTKNKFGDVFLNFLLKVKFILTLSIFLRRFRSHRALARGSTWPSVHRRLLQHDARHQVEVRLVHLHPQLLRQLALLRRRLVRHRLLQRRSGECSANLTFFVTQNFRLKV